MGKFNLSSKPSQDSSRGREFPDRLKEYGQWLVTIDKKPVIPSSGWNSSENLLNFAEAHRQADEVGGDVAFCFTDGGPFIGFDLDDVWQSGSFTDEAKELVERLDSYTERSTSGEGLHIIAEGERLENTTNRSDLPQFGHLEVYDWKRYFVLTGDVYAGNRSVESRPTVVREVQDNHLPEQEQSRSEGKQKPQSEQSFTREKPHVSPQDVRWTIEIYGRKSNNDVDGEEILRLWDGSDLGYESTSEADMAFVSHLYFWCKGDCQLVDDCFRASNRYRRKWNEIHYANGQTYGERTISAVSSGEKFQGDYISHNR
jgi:primase-polymerase (primpol)-like protein